jgi:branched-chain amino acid transport system permease protein
MSGVGLVVLFRTTGVLNLAYGAVGALGSLVAFTLIDHEQNEWMSYGVAIMLAGVLTLIYGVLLGPPLANRDPLVKASATLGFALILLGFMQWRWTADVRSLDLPTSDWQYTGGTDEWLRINWTQAIAVIFPIVVAVGTTVFLKKNKTGTAMRALADDRDNTALLGVPVRRVEASAWFVSGLLFGFSGLLLADLVSMEIAALTFSLPIAALAAALIGRLESLWVTLVAAFVIGVIQAELNAFSSLAEYRNMTPFVCAILVLLWFGWRRQVEGRVA